MAVDRSYEAALENKPSHWATVIADVFPKMISPQVTGGSTPAIDAFEKMRLAGATAREIILQAAAKQLDLPLSNLNPRLIGTHAQK